MTRLEPCPHCHRHVEITETACPFCARPLADDFADLPPRATPRARLGRAATFAFGVAALAQGGCGDDTTRKPPDAAAVDASPDAAAAVDASPDAGTPDADYDGGNVPIYAAAPTPDGGTTSRG